MREHETTYIQVLQAMKTHLRAYIKLINGIPIKETWAVHMQAGYTTIEF